MTFASYIYIRRERIVRMRKFLARHVAPCWIAVVTGNKIGTLRYEDGKLGRGRDWKSRTGTGPVVPAKNKKLKNVHFRAGRRRR